MPGSLGFFVSQSNGITNFQINTDLKRTYFSSGTGFEPGPPGDLVSKPSPGENFFSLN